MKPRAEPTEANLREAALAHLARTATTRAGLRRILFRRIDRWAAEASPDPTVVATLRTIAAAIVERLTAEGLLDDDAYARRRGLRLLQSGRSPQAAIAHLRAKGIEPHLATDAIPNHSLDAALILSRRRRIGPFRTGEPDPQREQAILARAGFAQHTARQALTMPLEEAEAKIEEFKKAVLF
jgi:regulatory protein